MVNYKDSIRSNGLRITPTRIAIIEILNQAKRPLDVSDILSSLENKKVYADQATVYRIIENFQSKGLIKRLQFDSRKFFYEKNGAEHHHAVCTNCGVLEDISNCKIPKLEKEIEESTGFMVKKHSLEFFGLCKNCK